MGTWGSGLFSDDVACDVKEYYMNCLREEMSPDEAESAVASYFSEELNDSDDGPIVVLAVADTAWRVGRLSDNLKNAAIGIIDTGEGLERWKDAGEKMLSKRKDVLLKLKERLLSTQPPQKKICKYRLYKCEWKTGDVFAYRLEGEFAKKRGYYGRYLLIQKVDEGNWYPGHVVPIVYFRMTNNADLPSVEDVNDVNCIKIAIGEKEPEVIYKYRGKILITSKRMFPKNLIYIGNTDVICPISEFIPECDVSYSNFEWKEIENRIIRLYDKFNKI